MSVHSAIIFSVIFSMPFSNAILTSSTPIREIGVKKVFEIEALNPSVQDYENFCIDAQGFIFFLDIKNNCVLVFDRAGKFVRQISQIGQEEKDLFQPRAIYVLSDGLYILDALGTCIKKYSTKGAYLKSIQIPRAFSSNTFVVDKNENILADTIFEEGANEGNNRYLISQFDRNGKIIKRMGKTIGAPNPLLFRFANTCLLARSGENRFVGAFAYRPMIFSYDVEGLEVFYKDLADGSIEEISLLDETLKDLRKIKPEYVRDGKAAKITGVQYFFGIGIDNKSEIFLATNRIVTERNERRGIVIHFNAFAQPIERLILRVGNEYVEHIRKLWIADEGERYALAYIKKNPFIIKF